MSGTSWGTRLCCLVLLLGHRGWGICRLLETRREAPGVGGEGTGRLYLEGDEHFMKGVTSSSAVSGLAGGWVSSH